MASNRMSGNRFPPATVTAVVGGPAGDARLSKSLCTRRSGFDHGLSATSATAPPGPFSGHGARAR